uniref:Uncharacterized protein n=1 Tax=Physcomitrium patens TaxID=3218 RepID=A0A2K1JS23_PHYPA|nr:hypothetical protein PHYPA_016715 [Physcomitrium patens]
MWKMSKNEPAEAAIPVVLEEMDFLVDAMAAQNGGNQNRRITRRRRRGQQLVASNRKAPKILNATGPPTRTRRREAPPESTERNRIMRHRRTLGASTTAQPAPSDTPARTTKRNKGRAARCRTRTNSSRIRSKSRIGKNKRGGNPWTLQPTEQERPDHVDNSRFHRNKNSAPPPTTENNSYANQPCPQHTPKQDRHQTTPPPSPQHTAPKQQNP